VIGGLSFAHPWALLGLLLLPLAGWLRHRILARSATPYAPLQHRPARRWRRLAGRLHLPLELLLLALLVVALAGPRRLDRVELIEDEGIDVVLVLDVSLSMLATDFPPDRLQALRRIARDFVHRAGGHRLGLVVFAGDTYVQTPLTTHRPTLLSLLEGVQVEALHAGESGGTAIGDALLVASELLERARLPGRDQALILITDGDNNVGSDPLLAARYARHLGIRSYLVGIGGERPVEVFYAGQRLEWEGQPYLTALDDAALQAVADAAGGAYFRAADVGGLEAIFAELARLESAPLEPRTVELPHPFAPRLAAALLPLFAGVLVLGGALLRRPLR